MRKLLAAPLLAVLMAACEDAGNEGNDNILTGASLILVVVVVILVAWLFLRNR